MKFNYKKKVFAKNFDKELEILTNSLRKFKLPPGFFDFIFYVISELFVNIKEHAQIKEGLIVLKIKENQCLIKVEDHGIGIRRSYLKKNIFPKDDFSAIEFALSGLSTKSFQERGFGLYSIRKLVETLKGKLLIKTGFAKVLIRKNKISFQRLKKEFKGTSVEIEVPIKKLDFYKIIT